MAKVTTYNMQVKAPLPALTVTKAQGQTIFESFPGHKGRPGEKGGSSPKGVGAFVRSIFGTYKKAEADAAKLAATAPDIQGDLDYAAAVQAQMAKIKSGELAKKIAQEENRRTELLHEIYRTGPVPLDRAMKIIRGKGNPKERGAFSSWLGQHGYRVVNGKVVVFLDNRQPVRSAYPEKLDELKRTGKITRKPYLGDTY